MGMVKSDERESQGNRRKLREVEGVCKDQWVGLVVQKQRYVVQ